MSEERKAALKELEHPDPLQQVFVCLWLLQASVGQELVRLSIASLENCGRMMYEPLSH
jgi:hypothetical protein